MDIGDGAFDELISYHELSQLIHDHDNLQEHDTDPQWTFTASLDLIYQDDPVSLATYAQAHDLLTLPMPRHMTY